MKQFILSVFLLAATASAMPRYLVVPIEDVEFVGGQPGPIPVYPMPYQHRVARQLQEEEPIALGSGSIPNRRDGSHPHGGHGGHGVPGSFIEAIGAAGIPPAADNLASGSSSYSAPPKGVDYVDYGAYTGKHGAFGWYSDHPVCLNCH